LNDLKTSVFANQFSHIYVEKGVMEHPRTAQVLRRFSNSTVVECSSYKDIFCRSHQEPSTQRQSRSLILAQGNAAIYPGAKVCQSMGNEHFYYTSCVMNCIYDCEYCYLQGMYRSAHMVMFVDLSETFRELDKLLAIHPVYLCISYDTDLLAIEPLTGYLAEWCEYLATRPNCTVEVRTKCASAKTILSLPKLSNMIFAFTLSPQEVISRYEHSTPSLKLRLEAVDKTVSDERKVRLCFDPMLALSDFETVYRAFFNEVFETVSGEDLFDVSVGVFRISKDYLKNMREARECSITYYPYTLTNGVYHYDEETEQRLFSIARDELSKHLPSDKIFFWTEC